MRRTVGFCVKYEVACQFIKGGVQFVSGSCYLVYVSFSVLFNSCKAAIQGVPSSQWCSWWHAQLVSSRCRFPIWRVLAGLGELLSATAGCWGSSQSPVLQHFSCCPHCGVIQPGNRGVKHYQHRSQPAWKTNNLLVAVFSTCWAWLSVPKIWVLRSLLTTHWIHSLLRLLLLPVSLKVKASETMPISC